MKPRVSFEDLEAIVRSRVCAVCAEKTTDSICGLEDPNHCSVFRLFPLVVEAILATDSDKLEPYIDAIREHVCSVCIDQQLDGNCVRRGDACALDAYLPAIVDAIEEALGRKFDRTKSSGLPAVL
jgi:hypothetical protein